MKPIGGYFQIELAKKTELHFGCVRVNSARNALTLYLSAQNFDTLYAPFYTCEVINEVVNKLQISLSLYHIDKNFFPILNSSEIQKNSVVLLTNYFGICDNSINDLIKKHTCVVVDNSQAFYHKPDGALATIYSPRKFFGVPDGGYLCSNFKMDNELEQDYSSARMEHLIASIEGEPELYYQKYKMNELTLNNQPCKKMSGVSKAILKSIDYDNIKMKRLNNFKYLHRHLKRSNLLSGYIENNQFNCPMIYPYLNLNGLALRKKLILNKVFVAQYWPEVLGGISSLNSFEKSLRENLVSLPIDQRYDTTDMDLILSRMTRE